MDVKHINPFIKSTCNIFATMLDCEIHRKGLHVKEDCSPSLEISGVIGLSGKSCGCVVFSLSREVAFKIAEGFLLEKFSTISEEVIDAVGELTNMIAGGAKKELSQYELNLGLPTVVVGRNHLIWFPKDITPICVEFETRWGPVALEVGLQTDTIDALPEMADSLAGVGAGSG